MPRMATLFSHTRATLGVFPRSRNPNPDSNPTPNLDLNPNPGPRSVSSATFLQQIDDASSKVAPMKPRPARHTPSNAVELI